MVRTGADLHSDGNDGKLATLVRGYPDPQRKGKRDRSTLQKPGVAGGGGNPGGNELFDVANLLFLMDLLLYSILHIYTC